MKVTLKNPPPMKEELIDGQRITDIRTLGSTFDNGKIIHVFLDTGEMCKMDIREFLKIINGVCFRATPKRVYRHLTIE